MTPDEKRMLSDLAAKVAQTPAPPRDPEAEDFIRSHIGSRPDALYLMTQTVLIQNLALERAQEQMRQLQSSSQPVAAPAGGSFLGGVAGPRPAVGYQAPPPQYAPQYAAPSQSGPSPSTGPSFLRGAAQTAAGVAAGALAFEGIQALFSHPGYGGGGIGGFGALGGGFDGRPVEETVVNNYYEGDDRGGREEGDRRDARDDYQAADDARDDSRDVDVSDSDVADDSGAFDDTGSGDSFS
jgi:hypothetical protein